MQSSQSEDAWHAWLAEAEAIVRRWENTHSPRMLSTTEAAHLGTMIARALQSAYDRGKASSG